MRTVRDQDGLSWICLELPEIPRERQAVAATIHPEPIAIECNSGAARAIALVADNWVEAMSDVELLAAIRRSLI